MSSPLAMSICFYRNIAVNPNQPLFLCLGPEAKFLVTDCGKQSTMAYGYRLYTPVRDYELGLRIADCLVQQSFSSPGAETWHSNLNKAANTMTKSCTVQQCIHLGAIGVAIYHVLRAALYQGAISQLHCVSKSQKKLVFQELIAA